MNIKRKILFSGLLITVFGLHQKLQASEELKVLSFNIDTNILRTEEGFARDTFPEWRVGARMPILIKTLDNLIKEHGPDVIQLQEGRKFDTKQGDHVDSITPLVDFLKSKGYHVNSIPYNPSLNLPPNKAFSYIEAIKSNFSVESQELEYFTKTPHAPTDHKDHFNGRKEEIKDHNFGEEWERSAYITKFHNTITGQLYYAFNIHLGIGAGHRKQACRQLRDKAKDIVTREPYAKIVMTGDFNTFPDWGGPEQLEIMRTNSVLKEVTENLLLQNGKKTNSSFIAYPFDFGADSKRLDPEIKELYDMSPDARRARIIELYQTQCKSLGGLLDRVFQYGYKKGTTTLLPTPQFENFDLSQWKEEYIKAYIIKHINKGPAFASDHQPVLTILNNNGHQVTHL